MSVRLAEKGQYFTIDAFIASVIVEVSIIIVLAARANWPYVAQSELLSKGFTDSFSQTKLSELNDQVVANMLKNGTITNLDNTILQQVAEFYFTGNTHYASELLKNITYQLVPPQYSFKVIVNNEQIYARLVANENLSSVVTSSKKLVSGVVNRTEFVYGPTIAEVRVWQ